MNIHKSCSIKVLSPGGPWVYHAYKSHLTNRELTGRVSLCEGEKNLLIILRLSIVREIQVQDLSREELERLGEEHGIKDLPERVESMREEIGRDVETLQYNYPQPESVPIGWNHVPIPDYLAWERKGAEPCIMKIILRRNSGNGPASYIYEGLLAKTPFSSPFFHSVISLGEKPLRLEDAMSIFMERVREWSGDLLESTYGQPPTT